MGLLDELYGSGGTPPNPDASFGQLLSSPMAQGLLAAGLGALASAGKRGNGPLNTIGQGGLMGLQAYSGAQENAAKQKYMDAQMANLQSEAEQRNTTIAALKRKQAALPGLFQGGSVPAAPGQLGSGSFGVQAPAAGQPDIPTGTATPQLDWRAALQAGYTPDEINKLATLPNAGRAKVTRTVKGLGPDGREYEYQVDEFGQKVGDGFAQYRAPISVNQGDRTTFADPYNLKPVGNFQTFQSPDSKASTAVTMRGQNMTDARAREKNQIDANAIGKVEWKQDVNGNWVGLPREVNSAGPVQPVFAAVPGKRETQANNALAIIDQAAPLIDQATGSYAGAGVDMLARGVGASTKGSEATAKLKALEGALMMAQPRMEGPQSDKDVALYRQMAGQIGDPTVPASQKKAALATIRELHGRYATDGGAVAADGPAPAAPKAAAPKAAPPVPMKGMVRNGYRFKGGDPSKQESWEKA